MSYHPDGAALAAYVLGHDDEIDRAAIEAHVGACEACLDEVGREARLELLLAAAGREDVFAVVAVPLAPRRRRWPVVAVGGVVAVAGAAAAVALWHSRPGAEQLPSRVAPAAKDGSPAATLTDQEPDWARGLRLYPGVARCFEVDGGLTCAAASEVRALRDEAAAEAGDVARVAMLERALARGGPTITAQRAVLDQGKGAALAAGDLDRDARRDRYARLRHEVAEHALLGRRDSWFWEEYAKLDGPGSEFVVFVRFRASKAEIDEFLARYRGATVERAVLVPALPSIYWVLDPGDKLAFFVYRAGKLADLGIRARDVLLMDQRLNADGMRALVESDRVMVWRAGLDAPVAPSKLR